MLEKITFHSSGTLCRGLYYEATDGSAKQAIIMAHGLGSLKEMRLPAYAERFVEAGFDVLIFDYRHFGESEGQPRQILDVKKQHQDWLAAVKYMIAEKGFETKDLVLWGTSLSGGHVLAVADKLPGLAAVISQVPHTDAIAAAKASGIMHGLKMSAVAIVDSIRGLLGLSPIYLHSSGKPGELAFMTAEGEHEGYLNLVPEGTDFDRRIAARFALDVSTYNPGKILKKLKMPVLVQVALQDVTTPPEPAIKACKNVPHAELKTYDLGHFQPYVGSAFEMVIADQLAFLNKVKK